MFSYTYTRRLHVYACMFFGSYCKFPTRYIMGGCRSISCMYNYIVGCLYYIITSVLYHWAQEIDHGDRAVYLSSRCNIIRVKSVVASET